MRIELEDTLLERANDVQSQPLLDHVLAENDVPAQHGARDLILRPTHGAEEHVADSCRGSDGRLESPQVHADIGGPLFHLVLPFSSRLLRSRLVLYAATPDSWPSCSRMCMVSSKVCRSTASSFWRSASCCCRISSA